MALSEKNQKPGVSSGFKIEVIKVSIALLLFVLVYISLFVVSLSAALLFTYFGIKLILFKPMFLTFIFGIGISIFGSLLFFFIIKFLFQKPEKAPVYEIPLSPEDYPELHAFVNQIAKDAGTSKPRKIVLYPNVNAGVYYNSAFLSMFFPVRKNLGIGMGLINSVNISEFKAILAHEFGIFLREACGLEYMFIILTKLFIICFSKTKHFLKCWKRLLKRINL